VRITKAEAIALARTECEKEGWLWQVPAKVRVVGVFPPEGAGWRQYEVRLPANAEGGYAWFLIPFDGRHVNAGWTGPGLPDDEDE
jgi:hypothetical protein